MLEWLLTLGVIWILIIIFIFLFSLWALIDIWTSDLDGLWKIVLTVCWLLFSLIVSIIWIFVRREYK